MAKKPKFPTKVVSKRLKEAQRIQLPTKRVMSEEQAMLGQMFGDGGKFYGSGEMIPLAGKPDGKGRDTWEAFGL